MSADRRLSAVLELRCRTWDVATLADFGRNSIAVFQLRGVTKVWVQLVRHGLLMERTAEHPDAAPTGLGG